MVTEETWFFPESKIESNHLSDYSSLLISFHTQELDFTNWSYKQKELDNHNLLPTSAPVRISTKPKHFPFHLTQWTYPVLYAMSHL